MWRLPISRRTRVAWTKMLMLLFLVEVGGTVNGQDSVVDASTKPTTVRYVLEPFEYIDNTWAAETSTGDATSTNINITISEEGALVGRGSLQIDFDASAKGETIQLRSILDPNNGVHNCHNAEYISFLYKNVGGDNDLVGTAPIPFQLFLFDDSECVTDCSNPDNLKAFPLLDDTFTLIEPGLPDWQRVKISELPDDLELRRIRGWKLELADSTGRILLDQLACVGGGSLLGAPFHLVASDDGAFLGALEDGIWDEEYYLSELAQKASTIRLIDGRFSFNYTIEQTANWGGFTIFSHPVPGAAYYDLSSASDVTFSYNVGTALSSPGRAHFRLTLDDGSDCFDACNEGHRRERWYSFHYFLDLTGPGQPVIPLEGDTEPGSSFWLTGWAGEPGNSHFDLDRIKGFHLEFSIDNQMGIGNTVSGDVDIWDFAAIDRSGDSGDGDTGDCVVEDGVFFSSTSPEFTRFWYQAPQCCQICKEDPTCLYAVTTGTGHCYTGAALNSSFVGLVHTRNQQATVASMWMGDEGKRGQFCQRCECRPEDLTIDCSGRGLLILPKTFNESWTPTVLDLRENPQLVFVGRDSLSAISQSLQEIWFPAELRHLVPSTLEKLPVLKSVRFEGDTEELPLLNNVIKTERGFYSDVCCSRGTTIDLEPLEHSITFCDMQVTVPGIDSNYMAFEQFIDSHIIETLTPSSEFMAEAAQSPEKCAAYCTINEDCRYFSFDQRVKRAEHVCYLQSDSGSGTQRICCDADHYADMNQTLPGWVSGHPPRTRHELDNATVQVYPRNVQANEENGFEIEYEVSLGSTPLRGAVWVEPTPVSLPADQELTIHPSRVTLYDNRQRAKISVFVHDETIDSTVLIRNVITSCDSAFMRSEGSDLEIVSIEISLPTDEDSVSLALAVGLPVAFVFAVVVVVALFLDRRQRRNEAMWKVAREELMFGDPPEVVGQGTFGLVLLAEYRGTNVAVKRLIPEKKGKEKKQKKGSDAGSVDTGNGSIGPAVTSRVDMTGDTGREMAPSSGSDFSLGRQNGFVATLNTMGTRKSNWNSLRKDFIEEMRHLAKLRHPCITMVMGAVIDNNVAPLLVMEYMDHGSLYDVLHNETMVFEGEIVLPILNDITQGMRFLHTADPQVVHGDLKSHNILVDSKFRAKVADFGLSSKKLKGATGTPYWMAPELLRGESGNTTASDVYSFGIILYEVYSRRDPYEGEKMKEVLALVKDQATKKRPPVPPNCPRQVEGLMAECVRDDSTKRPTFEELDIRLRREDIDSVGPSMALQVPQRQAQISLLDIFPKHIAEALRDGRSVEAEHHDCVTIFFSDIVGYTDISSTLSPHKVANLLDRLYTKFDDLSRRHDIFKVETIGDAYMAVTNLVKDQSDDHATRIATFAIDTVKAAKETLVDVEDASQGYIHIRAGFHSGSIVADVVGTRNPRYCLFGDAVNTASRMESNSKTDRIHCSAAAADILRGQCPEFPLVSRGIIPIKGKGEMHTYWVNES